VRGPDGLGATSNYFIACSTGPLTVSDKFFVLLSNSPIKILRSAESTTSSVKCLPRSSMVDTQTSYSLGGREIRRLILVFRAAVMGERKKQGELCDEGEPSFHSATTPIGFEVFSVELSQLRAPSVPAIERWSRSRLGFYRSPVRVYSSWDRRYGRRRPEFGKRKQIPFGHSDLQ
jgi:hypothetical protein